MNKWLKPLYHYNIQVFLSFANVYYFFISAFLKIAKPMIDLLKGGSNGRFHGTFVPSVAMQQLFRQLKVAFTSAPVLVHLDLAKLIRLKKDASGYAISGNVLQQAREV